MVDEPALTAINMRLRDDYVADCAKGVERWNRVIEKTGVNFRLDAAPRGLPSPHRRVPERQGVARRRGASARRSGPSSKDQWLPSKDDGDFIESLMAPVLGARQVRLLDRPAQGRHRQQGRRLRVREDPSGLCENLLSLTPFVGRGLGMGRSLAPALVAALTPTLCPQVRERENAGSPMNAPSAVLRVQEAASHRP